LTPFANLSQESYGGEGSFPKFSSPLGKTFWLFPLSLLPGAAQNRRPDFFTLREKPLTWQFLRRSTSYLPFPRPEGIYPVEYSKRIERRKMRAHKDSHLWEFRKGEVDKWIRFGGGSVKSLFQFEEEFQQSLKHD